MNLIKEYNDPQLSDYYTSVMTKLMNSNIKIFSKIPVESNDQKN